MDTSSEIWLAFARTFSVLILVLALIIFVFYLIKKFSMAKGAKGGKDFIKVLCIHHLSPKEKLVLLNVLGDTILIGVTPTNISKISSLDKDMYSAEDSEAADETSFKFADFLTQKLGSSFKNKESGFLKKGAR